MLFRFSLTEFNGESSSHEEDFSAELGARLHIVWLFRQWPRLKSVTLHRHLDRDSCGPIEFVGTFFHDGTKVVNRVTKRAL